MIRRDRTLTGRLGAALLRRRGEDPTQVDELPVKGGQVIHIEDVDLKPLDDVLSRSRYQNRPARLGDNLHVSDLVSKCVRKYALAATFGQQKPPQSISVAQDITFSQGEIIHEVVRKRAAIGGPTSVWGNWKCLCGATKTTSPVLFDQVKDAVCPTCRGPLNLYVEISVIDPTNKIVGHPDLLLWMSDVQALYIEEIKSIAPDAWKELVRPDPEHVIQVLFYWYLMRLNGYQITNRVSITYFTKGFVFKGVPWKEFTLDAEAVQTRLEPYMRPAIQMVAFKAGGPLPDRLPDCPTPTATKAKNCDFCRACFGSTDDRPTTVNIAETFKKPSLVEHPIAPPRPRARRVAN